MRITNALSETVRITYVFKTKRCALTTVVDSGLSLNLHCSVLLQLYLQHNRIERERKWSLLKNWEKWLYKLKITEYNLVPIYRTWTKPLLEPSTYIFITTPVVDSSDSRIGSYQDSCGTLALAHLQEEALNDEQYIHRGGKSQCLNTNIEEALNGTVLLK